MFVDRVIIQLKAGKGGNGVVAWRREKFIPKGGPSGGNGGDGASVILQADHDTYSLEDYRNRRILNAENGAQGAGGQKQGKRGRNLILKVPIGTLLKDASTGTLLYDFTVDKETFIVCQGGKGGKGNCHFKSARNRTPNQATPGIEGEENEVELELKIIADVGLVGFPNAGKSTFLTRVTHVPVKIAPYPFTTLRPNLGFIGCEYGQRILLADIPGIIAGASQNKGLGLEFLRHIERTELLLFLLDASGSEERDPSKDYQTLREEISAYNPQLLEKPFFVALNKIDVEGAQEQVDSFKKSFKGDFANLFEVSAQKGEGISHLVECLKRKLNK